MAALLAVTKAGGVYIPLDPLYPADRCAGMMEDGAARALITVQVRARCSCCVASNSPLA